MSYEELLDAVPRGPWRWVRVRADALGSPSWWVLLAADGAWVLTPAAEPFNADAPVPSAVALVPELLATAVDAGEAVLDAIGVLRRHGALALSVPVPETAVVAVRMLDELCDRLAADAAASRDLAEHRLETPRASFLDSLAAFAAEFGLGDAATVAELRTALREAGAPPGE